METIGVYPLGVALDEEAIARGMRQCVEDAEVVELHRVMVLGKVGNYPVRGDEPAGMRRVRCLIVWKHRTSGQLLPDLHNGGWQDFDLKLLRDFETMGREEK